MNELSISKYVAGTRNGQTFMPTGSNTAIAEWTTPGTPKDEKPQWMAPLHFHHKDDEAWFILEGTLGFRIGDETIEAGPNETVIVPSGIAHTFWNPKQTPARYLIVMTKEIKMLIDEIHNTLDRDPESMKKLFKKYNAELL